MQIPGEKGRILINDTISNNGASTASINQAAKTTFEDLDAAKPYTNADICVTPLKGKRPILTGWQDTLLHNIPEELRRRPQWIVWKLETRDGKLNKVPFIAGGVGKSSSTDLLTWRTFEEAVAALKTGRYEGVGFVFCSADPFVGVDLDDCRDPEAGEIAEWAQEIIDTFNDVVLVEVSPSGGGVHLITRGKCKDGVNTKDVEIYGQDRFFTITGVTL